MSSRSQNLEPRSPEPQRRQLPEERRGALEAEDGRSIGQLLADVSSNISSLMQQELALAKAELRESVKRAGKGIGLMAGAAIGAFFVLLFLSTSGWWALGMIVGNGWSALIVAGVWAIIAIVLGLVGKKELERIRGLDRTTDTLSKLPKAAQGHEEDNR
ncbi:phage holin family protein [Propionimicrobium sp. PCR01-08-3]|uniref:phage holin family protein n=1 Tax=Propionimicrobium sp. PCR01-08-3 TaxID=3052086 RepID=UPI00255C4339|nr:phage holin family protein [Propionimicrobium sp. PCR01-08-3]WIY82571.1 phage holin family protein [Propionimicrobium sp. PCR01-08-3]